MAGLLIGLIAFATPAAAQDRVIGLLALPELFGHSACDQYEPGPVALHGTPGGRNVGTVSVVTPWSFQAGGGCSGLEVGVRTRPEVPPEALPTLEFGYEAPGAIVLERREQWFRVRLASGSAWLEASEQDEFFDLPRLYTDSLTYLTEDWTGQIAADPGGILRTVQLPTLTDDQPVTVSRSTLHSGMLWLMIEILSHSACTGDDEPTVAARGWVPAYGEANEPTVWFHSRGC